MRKRLQKFKEENWQEVLQTTWDPEGPGCVRVHLVFPDAKAWRSAPALVIVNGMDVIPMGLSWAVLLTLFIQEVNANAKQGLNADEMRKIVEAVVKKAKKIYPFIVADRFRRDMIRIMDTLTDVARGQVHEEEIGYISMADYAPYMKAPHRMDLMISAMEKNGKWNCNQKCLHCYAAGQSLSAEQELDTDSWIRIIDKCRKTGIPQITFTGGEPTLRPDLPKLVKHARWFITRLNTNGLLLTKELVAALKEAELDSVQVTFYSENEETHNTLVGSDAAQNICFSEADSAAENSTLAEAGAAAKPSSCYQHTLQGIKNAVAGGLNISINTPLCRLNRDYVKTLALLKNLGITYVTCSGMIMSGNATKEKAEQTQLTSDELYQVLKQAVEYTEANGMEVDFTSPGWIEDEKLKELKLRVPSCGAGLSNMAISPSGNVIPCQSSLSEDAALGDFLQQDWKTIWESDKTKQHRDFSAKMTHECPLKNEHDRRGIK